VRVKLDRRELLRQASLAAAGVALACRKQEKPAEVAAAPPPPPVAAPAAPQPGPPLSQGQRATLDAATARILPSGKTPGAREANVVEYLDRELRRPAFRDLRTSILAGTVALDRVATRVGSKPFTELAPELQDQVIGQVQTGSQRGADFVDALVVLTLEGFLGDPKYGGNQGGVGWEWAGYSPLHGHEVGVKGHHHHE
jgi:gluconate 2-dehydrogenase gamma chain